MNIQPEKIELVKQILDTEDEALISDIKATLAGHQHVVHEDLPEYDRRVKESGSRYYSWQTNTS